MPAGVQFYGIEHKPIIDVNSADCPDDKHIVIGALSTGDPILCERDGEKSQFTILKADGLKKMKHMKIFIHS